MMPTINLSCWYMLLMAQLWMLNLAEQESCDVSFITQPPRNLPCNPYLKQSNAVQLQCSVSSSVTAAVDIVWYRNVSNAEEKRVETIANDMDKFAINIVPEGYFTANVITSTLSVRYITEADAGIYWCEAVRTTRAVDDSQFATRHFRPCYFTTLLPSSEYSHLTVCPSTAFTLPEPACVFPFTSCSTVNESTNTTSSSTVNYSPVPSTSSKPITPSSQSIIAPSSQPIAPSPRPKAGVSNFLIPLWMYPIIVIPLLIGICCTVANVAYLIRRCIKRSRRNVKIKSKSVENGQVIVQPLQRQLGIRRQKQIPHNDIIGKPLPQHLSVAKQVSISSMYDDVIPSPKAQQLNAKTVEGPSTLAVPKSLVLPDVEKAPKVNQRSCSLPENRKNVIQTNPLYENKPNLASPEDHVTIFIGDQNMHQIDGQALAQPWYQPLVSKTRDSEQDDYCTPGCTVDDDFYDYQDPDADRPQTFHTSSSANLFSVVNRDRNVAYY